MENKQSFFWNLVFPVLIALIMFHSAFNLWFLSVDQTPLYQDSRHSYLNMLQVRDSLPKTNLIGKVKLLYYHTPYDHGLVLQLPGVIATSLFGASENTASMASVFFIALLLFAVYGLGVELFSREVGLLAALIVTFYPAVFYISRIPIEDLPLAAMVTLCALCLVKTERFSNWRWALVLGTILGLTALTKPSFSLFLIGPFAVETLLGAHPLMRERQGGAFLRLCANLVLVLAISGILAISWYSHNPLEYLKEASFPRIQENPLQFDVVLLFRGLLSDLGLVLFLLSLLILLRKQKTALFLLGWITLPVITYSFLYPAETLLHPPSLRYLTPIVPAIALVIANGIDRATTHISRGYARRNTKFVKPIIYGIVVLIHVNLFTVISTPEHVGLPQLTNPLNKMVWYGITSNPPFTIPQPTEKFSPNLIRLRYDELLSTLSDIQSERGQPLILGSVVLSSGGGYFAQAFVQKIQVKELLEGETRFIFTDCEGIIRTESLAPGSYQACLDKLLESDIVVLDWFALTPSADGPPEFKQGVVSLFLKDTSGHELLYAAPMHMVREELSIREGNVDYLNTDPASWGSEEWQVPISLDTLDEFAGAIYIKKQAVLPLQNQSHTAG